MRMSMDGVRYPQLGFLLRKAREYHKNRRDWESFKKGYRHPNVTLPLQVTSEHQRLLKWTDDDIDTVSAEGCPTRLPGN